MNPLRCLVVLFAVWLALAVPPLPVQAEDLSFNRDVRRILSEKCFACHGPDANQRKADLRLDVEEEAKAYAIDVENPDSSELLMRILSEDPDVVMPPPEFHKPVTADEIAILKQWIEQGAPYELHWSFIPPQRTELPRVESSDWQQPIDRFVAAQWVEADITPAEPADRAALLRRVTLDLTGVPPTISELQQFRADSSPNAYEKVVDRLLQSTRYGEHMARYWMDVSRYADTNGYQYDLERDQWVWRDWVIDAFNQNMPYDQFTVEQLAGDLLPDATDEQRLATGFHRNHPITIEGGVIDEEYRTEYVIDRVVTTSTVWLGLTTGCARCHDHKYDPISQEDFYEFFAFFNNVPEKGFQGFNPKSKIVSPLAASQFESMETELQEVTDALRDQLAKRPDQLTQWRDQAIAEQQDRWNVVRPESLTASSGTSLDVQADGSILASGSIPDSETYEVTWQLSDRPLHGLRLTCFADASTPTEKAGRSANGNFVLSELIVETTAAADPAQFKPVKIAQATADYSQANYDISRAIDGKQDDRGWAIDGHERVENRVALFEFAEPIDPASSGQVRVRLVQKHGSQHQIGRFALETTDDPQPMPPEMIAQLKSTPTVELPEDLQWALARRYGEGVFGHLASTQQTLLRKLEEARESIPATMVMMEMESPRDAFVLNRGEYDQFGKQVHADTPAALPPMSDTLPRNRLGLARWLTMPDHPLTARVAVNRFWQQLFGTGLVKTVEDFGAQGEWPSHPGLLDHLALEFVESGWNVKQLLKQIVMSSTYRQSSKIRPDLHEVDPENRLLARGPRLRLDAETIRDSALFASGLLNEQLGGSSVFPYHPMGLWQEINNRPGLSRTYQRDSGEKLYRRSLYTFWKRTVPPPSMAAFDAPGREFCVARRSRTNTPLQAFVLLHDPQFVEAARHLAGRIMADGGASDQERLSFAYRVALAREPSPAELDVLQQIVESRRAFYTEDSDAAMKLLQVGESPVDSRFEPSELATWTIMARTLMNTSEFITKP